DLIRLDIGLLTNWYLAEIARTIVFGKATGKVKRMHSALIKSQEEAIKTIMPNVRSFEIDSVARNSLRADGFADYYIHSTGHGLNLVNYWQPTLSAVDNTLIRPNMALSIEPGIYMEKASSVHVEDAVIVNDDGVEVLTKYPHELEIT
ncbi:MAG: M24 family metallopeptidase, partial [Candidatus Hodarchaeota archaeon]